MSFKFQTILGYFLLIFGLAIIIFGLYHSLQIFTAKTVVPEIFKVQTVDIAQPKSANPTSGMFGIDVEKILGGEIQRVLPADYVPRLLNLFSWSIFSGILFFGGGQIAGLGIKLLKN